MVTQHNEDLSFDGSNSETEVDGSNSEDGSDNIDEGEVEGSDGNEPPKKRRHAYTLQDKSAFYNYLDSNNGGKLSEQLKQYSTQYDIPKKMLRYWKQHWQDISQQIDSVEVSKLGLVKSVG